MLTVKSVAVPGDPNEASNYTTTYAYDTRDRLSSVTLPLANKISYTYEDGTNRLTDTIRADSAGNQKERIHLTLNTIGGKRQEDAQACTAGNCTTWTTRRTDSFTYDTHNRLQTVTHPDATHIDYTYDSRGNLLTVRDENHASANTTYTYDALNRLTKVTQTLTGAVGAAAPCTAAAGQIATCYGYDVQDNLTSVFDPNLNTTTYLYDDFRRVQSQASPVSNATKYSYDAAGNLTTSVDARQALNQPTDKTTRTYDAANRITSSAAVLTGQATETVTWSYDDADLTQHKYRQGRVASMTDPSGTTTYAYERRGLVKSEIKTIGLNTYTLGYGYDANGNRSSIRYPSGRLVTYTFDFADRALSAGSSDATFVTSATYQPFGPEATLSYGNGTMRTATYDQRYRPTEIKLANGGTTIADNFYSEDAVGNIKSICAASGACTTPSAAYDRVFSYDDLNRLTTAKAGTSLWGTASGNGFAYDSIGNMTSAVLGSISRTFIYLKNGSNLNLPKLASVTETGLGTRGVFYDASGNESSVANEGIFTYSSRNYFSLAALASGNGLSYMYDGRGLRASVTRAGATLFPISLTVDPMSVKGGSPTTGKVTLNDTIGGTVTLSSSDASVTVPPTVAVSAGQIFSTFSVTTTLPASNRKVVITATLNGVAVTAVLTVTTTTKLLLLSLSPRTVHGGNPSTGTVVLNGLAPVGGAVVTLSSSNTSVATVPASVTVAQNQTSATFTVTTLAVTGSKSVDIKATYPTTPTPVDFHASLVVVAFAVQGISPEGPWMAGRQSPVLVASLGGWRETWTSLLAERGIASWREALVLTDDRFEGLEAESDGGGSSRSGFAMEAASPAGPVSRNFLYSPEMNLLAESELSYPREKAILYEYIWFNGHPVAQVDSAAVVHWTFTDHLGTPWIQTDSAGNVYWRAEYEPYGRIYSLRTANQHQPLRLPGQESEELNLSADGNGSSKRSYNIFRWYRSNWGRYTQADPIGLEGGVNVYRYAEGNPLSRIDPRGLACSKECPECPTGTWICTGFGGSAFGLFGTFGAGATYLKCHCSSGGLSCDFLTVSGKVGIGASIAVTGSGCAIFGGYCVDQILGLSGAGDVDLGKGVGGSLNVSFSTGGSKQLCLDTGAVAGFSAGGQVSYTFKLGCRGR